MIKKSIYRFMYANSNFSTKALILCFALSCMFTQNILGQSFLWAKATNGNIVSSSVATDMVGNIYVAGVFAGPTITFGGTTLINTGVGSLFLAKYDKMGNVIWARGAGDLGLNGTATVETDKFGDVYVTGFFYNSVLTFDTFVLTSWATSNLYVAQFDTSGNLNWAKASSGFAKTFMVCALS